MSRINVGVIRGGRVRNTISDKAVLELETRGRTSEVENYLASRAIQVIKGSRIQYDLDYEIKIAGSAPAIENLIYDFYDKIDEILREMGIWYSKKSRL